MDMIALEQLDYIEDKIINGILHYKLDGEWHEYSKEALTEMLTDEQDAFDSFIDRCQ